MSRKDPRYAVPRGPYAIAPGALADFERSAVQADNSSAPGAHVVYVRGALRSYSEGFGDSYDAIVDRVALAFQKSNTVVLSVDSPGGVVSGLFDACARIRALAAGRCLIGHTPGQATSAAYALLCACSKVYASEAALVGSIGVIAEVVDLSSQTESAGAKVRLVTSGARKADGHPMNPLDDAAIAATQVIVDDQAQLFFEHVAATRGVDVEALRALEAGLFVGRRAVSVGLIDGVATLDEAIAGVTPVRAKRTPPSAASAPRTGFKDEAEARAWLTANVPQFAAAEKTLESIQAARREQERKNRWVAVGWDGHKKLYEHDL